MPAAHGHAPRTADAPASARPRQGRHRPTSPLAREIEIVAARLGNDLRRSGATPRMRDRMGHSPPPRLHRQLPRSLERLARPRERHRLTGLVLRPLPRLRPRVQSQVERAPVDREQNTARLTSLQVKVSLHPLSWRHVNVWPRPRPRRIVRGTVLPLAVGGDRTGWTRGAPQPGTHDRPSTSLSSSSGSSGAMSSRGVVAGSGVRGCAGSADGQPRPTPFPKPGWPRPERPDGRTRLAPAVATFYLPRLQDADDLPAAPFPPSTGRPPRLSAGCRCGVLRNGRARL
ncbi:hypothetical protein A3Q37_00687 [Streptomyces sp. PTY087I2]|nr:hypothetical protein A3Q37_00687 [Streptomyces sp. PTY087I2]